MLAQLSLLTALALSTWKLGSIMLMVHYLYLLSVFMIIKSYIIFSNRCCKLALLIAWSYSSHFFRFGVDCLARKPVSKIYHLRACVLSNSHLRQCYHRRSLRTLQPQVCFKYHTSCIQSDFLLQWSPSLHHRKEHQ